MEEQILKDSSLFPNENVLKKSLGNNYPLLQKFLEKANAYSLEWNYYNDGKVWLGKLLYKKKNYGWLSIWNIGFKVSVFLTERLMDGFKELDIDLKIKASVNEKIGKLIPVITLISENNIDDVIKVLNYKKSK